MPREYKRALAEQAAKASQELEPVVVNLTGIAARVVTERAGTAVHG
jgi:hypothetical protein